MNNMHPDLRPEKDLPEPAKPANQIDASQATKPEKGREVLPLPLSLFEEDDYFDYEI